VSSQVELLRKASFQRTKLYIVYEPAQAQILAMYLIISEESCRAMAAADLRNLERCGALADGGAALVESVREGRGPRGLRLGHYEFDSQKKLISFMNALRGNTYLQRFELSICAPRKLSLVLCLRIRDWFTLVSLHVAWTSIAGASL
jgi:hypothetical protein